MAISKRLRFEILRRDNHACRYCGLAAPETELTVDHVIAVTLGGSDDPANLVAACRDCNIGKSSMSADATVVADVSAAALRWARAMELVAYGRAMERKDAEERYQGFLEYWMCFTYTNTKRHVDLPPDWKNSVDCFLNAGLEMGDLFGLIDIAMGSKTTSEWKYFCGCCWRRIRQAQEHAASIIAHWDETGEDF